MPSEAIRRKELTEIIFSGGDDMTMVPKNF